MNLSCRKEKKFIGKIELSEHWQGKWIFFMKLVSFRTKSAFPWPFWKQENYVSLSYFMLEDVTGWFAKKTRLLNFCNQIISKNIFLLKVGNFRRIQNIFWSKVIRTKKIVTKQVWIVLKFVVSHLEHPYFLKYYSTNCYYR